MQTKSMAKTEEIEEKNKISWMNNKIKIGKEVPLEEKVIISQMIEEILEVKMIILIPKFS